jgi:hypothetical protein
MAWNSVNLVTSQQVKDFTGLAKGIDDRKLDTSIHFAQNEAEQILGRTLYALVEAGNPVADPTMGGNAALVTLFFSYVQPFLCWKTKEDSGVDLWMDSDKNGIYVRGDETHTSVSRSAVDSYIGKARARAEVFEGKLLEYLKGLPASDPIQVAYSTDINCEPRVHTQQTGRIITRISPWQYNGRRYPYHGRKERGDY